jgi:hypothetical protein
MLGIDSHVTELKLGDGKERKKERTKESNVRMRPNIATRKPVASKGLMRSPGTTSRKTLHSFQRLQVPSRGVDHPGILTVPR